MHRRLLRVTGGWQEVRPAWQEMRNTERPVISSPACHRSAMPLICQPSLASLPGLQPLTSLLCFIASSEEPISQLEYAFPASAGFFNMVC